MDDNKTYLSVADIERYRGQRPLPAAGGKVRYYCPIHGSDNQRSLVLNPATGWYRCYGCPAKGFTLESHMEYLERRERGREQWIADRRRERSSGKRSAGSTARTPTRKPVLDTPSRPIAPPLPPARADLWDIYMQAISAFPGSPGAEYLERRGIPSAIAIRYSVGYMPAGRWPGRSACRRWNEGRVIFPHYRPTTETNSIGQHLPELVNLYGRAVELQGVSDKADRHDHLTGPRGWFNLAAVEAVGLPGELYVCEAPIDALSLIVAGEPRSLAIYGVNGWRWEWVRSCRALVLAFDNDEAGQGNLSAIALSGSMQGKDVRRIDPAIFGGCKDLNAALMAGHLHAPSGAPPPAGSPP